MLAKQPASRPANATEVAAELAAIAADLPESDRRPAALADGGTVALEDELRSWVVAPNRSSSAPRRRGDRHGGGREAEDAAVSAGEPTPVAHVPYGRARSFEGGICGGRRGRRARPTPAERARSGCAAFTPPGPPASVIDFRSGNFRAADRAAAAHAPAGREEPGLGRRNGWWPRRRRRRVVPAREMPGRRIVEIEPVAGKEMAELGEVLAAVLQHVDECGAGLRRCFQRL